MVSAVRFALQYNMTPVPVVNEEDYWGEIFANWSGNGLLGNLAMDKADIGFAVRIIMKPVLQQSLTLTEIPVELSSKFIMGLMLVLSLFLTSTYSSGLASIMTLPRYESAINTVDDFAQSGLDWGATQDAWITSIQNAKEFPENFAIGTYIKEDVISNFHLMQQDLYWEQCVIMLRKNSVLLPFLDLFILRIFEAGLISRWQNTFHKDGRCLMIFTDGDFNYHGNIPSVKIKVTNDTFNEKLIFHSYGCQNIIIYANKPVNIFVEFETQIRLNMERFNSRKFLIAPRIVTENFEKDFFGLKQLNYVCDLLVLSPKSCSPNSEQLNIFNTTKEEIVFELKTHKYVGTSNNNKPILLDKWFSKNQSFLFGRDLYPDKMTNQMGRPLKMTTFTYKPYAVIGNKSDELYGSEMMTSVTFALKHNMTPVAVDTGTDYWGDISPEFTGKGILGNLAEDKADVGFEYVVSGLFLAALYMWENCYHYLDLSKFVLRAGATLLVPAPRYPNRKKSNVIKFVESATLVVTKPTLQQGLTEAETPLEPSSKFIMFLMLILSLFLTNIYSSGLAAVMTLPRFEDAINTAADFAWSEVQWGATDADWLLMIRNSSQPQDVRIVSKFHIHSYEELRELSKTGKFGFIIERLPFGSFAIEPYIQGDIIHKLSLLHDDIYWALCVLMMRKSSVLMPAMDATILRTFEAGVVLRWQNE
ncbi:uncharacterized protein BDFB_007673, partial [Asbolus verrucosus]